MWCLYLIMIQDTHDFIICHLGELKLGNYFSEYLYLYQTKLLIPLIYP